MMIFSILIGTSIAGELFTHVIFYFVYPIAKFLQSIGIIETLNFRWLVLIMILNGVLFFLIGSAFGFCRQKRTSRGQRGDGCNY